MPAVVLLPGSTADIATTIRWAAKRGCTFAPQGQRHSVWGRSSAPGGIVADMTARHSVGQVRDDRIVVGAGTTWSEVLAATLPQGGRSPVRRSATRTCSTRCARASARWP
ncbi:FAD-binding protein [Rhodococcus sp. NPDC057014]|uniref:FAD-binding protein n=1 Tax=Rhodococcus sp. NPDC057014 TaxID=3346000 RepID=UPI0036415FA5